MICWKCGASCADENNFCSMCGANLREPTASSSGPRACRSCGEIVPPGSKFCGNCGCADPIPAEAEADAGVEDGAPRMGMSGRDTFINTTKRPRALKDSGPHPVRRDTERKRPSAGVEKNLEDLATRSYPAVGGAGQAAASRAVPPKRMSASAKGPTPRFAPPPVPPAPAQSTANSKSSADIPAKGRLGGTSKFSAADSSRGSKRGTPSSKPVSSGSSVKPKATSSILGAAKKFTPPPPPKPKLAKGASKPAKKAPTSPIAVPDGWPDITDDIADVDFLMLQGEEEQAREIVAKLRAKHPGHPDLADVLPEVDPAALGEGDEESTLRVMSSQPANGQPREGSRAAGETRVPRVEEQATDDDDEDDEEDTAVNVTDEAYDEEETYERGQAGAVEASGDEGPGEAALSSEERTLVGSSRQAPPPYGASPLQGASGEAQPWLAGAGTSSYGVSSRATVIPDDSRTPSPPRAFDGSPAPGSTFVPGTTPPPGGFPSRGSSGRPSGTQTEPHPTVAAALADDDEVEEAAPTLEPVATPGPTGRPNLPVLTDVGALVDDEVAATEGSKDVRPPERSPEPWRPPVEALRLVMLGARGEAVAERRIEVDQEVHIGRAFDDPWSDDVFLEPRHATVSPAPGGVAIEAVVPSNPVFRQLEERTRVFDGDEYRVGQSLIVYEMADGWGRLRVYEGASETPRLVSIGGSGLLVGRDIGDVLLSEDTYVSGEHCRFTCVGDEVYIEDLGSSNGTYVRVREGEVLPFGALVLMGQTQFRVRNA